MTGSPASASGESAAGTAELWVAPSWIGDTVMAWPAAQAWRRARPDVRMLVLAKPAPAALWRLHAAPDDVWTLAPGWRGVWRAARAARAAGVRHAWVLPHSFRSALIPWLARIPERIGPPGHARDALLTRVVDVAPPAGRHQSLEPFALLGLDPAAQEPPHLVVPEAARARAEAWWGPRAASAPRVAVMPGAARGASKCWPAERFVETARRLAAAGARIAVCGGAEEAEAARRMADAAGAAAIDLTGRTTLAEWAAVLAACDVAVANDSGGMHLAAAAGRPVVAIFGRTDPEVTGPLGEGHRILQAPGPRGRDIARTDAEAARRLAAIGVEQVVAAVMDVLRTCGGTGGA
jgi:heptosyltransferase II